jgi:hypothetical protein
LTSLRKIPRAFEKMAGFRLTSRMSSCLVSTNVSRGW